MNWCKLDTLSSCCHQDCHVVYAGLLVTMKLGFCDCACKICWNRLWNFVKNHFYRDTNN